jgi:hypothetical protein
MQPNHLIRILLPARRQPCPVDLSEPLERGDDCA